MSKTRGRGHEEKQRPTRLPSITMEDEEQSRAEFLEAMAKLEASAPPDKDAVRRTDRAETSGERPQNRKNSNITVDLHGFTLDEAEAYVKVRLNNVLDKLSGQTTVTIITGKGKHSGPGGSVLAKSIHSFVKRQFETAIVYIEESPADVIIGQLPLRGHFRVTLRR